MGVPVPVVQLGFPGLFEEEVEEVSVVDSGIEVGRGGSVIIGNGVSVGNVLLSPTLLELLSDRPKTLLPEEERLSRFTPVKSGVTE